jgi:peptidoglycan/LPS O-acetylase OafA/YrhL
MNAVPALEHSQPVAGDEPGLGPATKNLSRHIPFLDGLRGFAALWVMVGHSRSEAMATGLTGRLWTKILLYVSEGWGVPVFIVLSGFLLMTPLVGRSASVWRGFGPFMLRRAKRIYPAYLAAIALIVLLVNVVPYWNAEATARWQDALPISAACVLNHLLLIQYWFPQYIHKIDPPMWSLAVEWQIYVLFAAVLVPILVSRGMKGFFFAGTIIAALFAVIDRGFALLVECFVLGASASFISFSGRPVAEKVRASSTASILCPVCFLSAFLIYDRIKYLAPLLVGVGICLLLVLLCDRANDGLVLKSVRTVLASRASRLLGWCSYSLYLLHFVVISGVNAAAISAGVSASTRTFLVLVVAPALSLPIAFGFAWLFEYRLTPKRTPTV